MTMAARGRCSLYSAMMARKKRVAIVGGGATGASLLWCLTSQAGPRGEVEATLFHDEPEVGGHSLTIPVCFDADGRGRLATPRDRIDGRTAYPVDIGVQFVCESIYPNLYRQLELPELAGAVRLKRHPELKMSGAFGAQRLWGNFEGYQAGPRFGCFDAQTRALAERFQSDVRRTPWLRIDGRRVSTMTVGGYLDAAGYRRDTAFIHYLLLPYLSIINGYGTVDLLDTAMTDLFPLFTRFPGLQTDGPYVSFTEPGRGWDRFEDGATRWIDAMVAYATVRGAHVRTHSPVERVASTSGGVEVVWRDRRSNARSSACFDEVVLTTDMEMNRALLAHPANRAWDHQRDYIADHCFPLLPGVCYIHQDEELLAPELRDGTEDGQFVGTYAWGQIDETARLYGLSYSLADSFQTFSMQNILGTPAPCWVSMYAEDARAKTPHPSRTIFRRTWRHGRWVTSFFRNAKRRLAEVQGVGGIWFAGNNTTMDSQEGALVSAMITAGAISSWRYPFSRLSTAYLMYRHLRSTVLGRARLAEQYRRVSFVDGRVTDEPEERDESAA
jgi:predicted NAD/FAD-binding protein